ncbi:hypothetical protein LTR70_001205 [Exophiala xenobiotica]|uniref:Uncharacterized protein n=1 Tax=Lithohypha guttulata TaxID=1690604 RepID=A0ABR0KKE7_9EURO|nr:hypothetical protein LTR24_001456 [Lithohypha guttulata]KAK5328180.1 hypothetical protein LTR70_001205 [Exophiala xenobiotica]
MAQTTAGDLTKHPNPIPNAHHRKIELQSHADLTYLQQNLAQAAREKLDLHFPLSAKQAAPAEVITLGGAPQPTEAEKPDEEDPLRRHVRQLVDQFLQQTYTSAAHSISVNGIDASALPPSTLPSCSNPTPDPASEAIGPLDPSQETEGIHYTYSAFDPRLQKRLASLHGELESLTAQVSRLRREAPKSSADAYTSQLEAALARDEEEWEHEQMRLQNQTHTGLELDPMRHGWNEDLTSMYERGVADLAVLSGVSQSHEGRQDLRSLTETVGKVQRARNVAADFE